MRNIWAPKPQAVCPGAGRRRQLRLTLRLRGEMPAAPGGLAASWKTRAPRHRIFQPDGGAAVAGGTRSGRGRGQDAGETKGEANLRWNVNMAAACCSAGRVTPLLALGPGWDPP
ncbi:uncharacterized protein LOC134516856 [Chroicocephalus ridibundus]|uniref:uncharacterized protein LOC134516856 n=1 Tax=Chroicocephalus ridibundus TaxID=1192867 RepID=UPI002FDDFD7D